MSASASASDCSVATSHVTFDFIGSFATAFFVVGIMGFFLIGSIVVFASGIIIYSFFKESNNMVAIPFKFQKVSTPIINEVYSIKIRKVDSTDITSIPADITTIPADITTIPTDNTKGPSNTAVQKTTF